MICCNEAICCNKVIFSFAGNKEDNNIERGRVIDYLRHALFAFYSFMLASTNENGNKSLILPKQ